MPTSNTHRTSASETSDETSALEQPRRSGSQPDVDSRGDRATTGGGRPWTASGPSTGATRLALVIAITLLGMYGLRLTSRVLELQRAVRAEERLAGEVAALDAEVTVLETAGAEAGTERFAERWGREGRGWSKEGDEPIQIVPQGDGSVADDADGSGEEPDEGLLDRFWGWLTGR